MRVLGYSRVALGRIAQRESARFTRGRSLVRSQVRPSLWQAVLRGYDRRAGPALETVSENHSPAGVGAERAALPEISHESRERGRCSPGSPRRETARASGLAAWTVYAETIYVTGTSEKTMRRYCFAHAAQYDRMGDAEQIANARSNHDASFWGLTDSFQLGFLISSDSETSAR